MKKALHHLGGMFVALAIAGIVAPAYSSDQKANLSFAELQKRKILVLGRNHLDIRKMTKNDKVTVYYRDYERPYEPNTDKRDNLLYLPRYKHTES